MNPWLIGGLVGGAGGLIKSIFDGGRANRQRKLAAETARYSPWTGMQPQQVQEADPLGSFLQFGTTGAMMGQGMEKQDFERDMWKKLLERSGAGAGMAAGPSDLLNAHPWLAGGNYQG